MKHRRARRVAQVTALAVAIAMLGGAAPASAQEVPCPDGARCATLSVPLDHSGGTPGRESIAYAVLPATGTRTGTLVFLSGGPGEAAIPAATPLGRLLRDLRGSYDLVFPDQRGTGASGAVDCELDSEASVTACGERFGARRAFMSTRETALDLEDLRVALGAEQLTLLGVSYGGKVAQTYARLFPQRTAAMVLDSPAPVDGLDAIFQLRQIGLKRTLREVCQPGTCKQTLRDAGRALSRVAERLQRGPLRGTVVQPDGSRERSEITEEVLYQLIVLSDLDPILRTDLPGAIGSAAEGDPAALLRIVGFFERAEGGPPGQPEIVNTGRLLATSCLEGRLPWSPDAPVAGREDALAALLDGRRDAFEPFSVETVIGTTSAALCTAWPPTQPVQGVAYGGPDIPVLVISGREDLRTPLEDARRTGFQYPNAKVLPVPDVGHSVLVNDLTGCALEGMTAFLAGETVEYCERQERPRPPAPVIPEDLDDFRAPRGLPVATGRTLNAVGASLFAVGRETAVVEAPRRGAALPGLRRGVIVVYPNRVRLVGVEWVRGVRLTGTIRRRSGRIVVSGSAAVDGVLEHRGGGSFRGTLGDRRVAIRTGD